MNASGVAMSGLAGAGAHGDACAGADEIHAGAGLDFAGLDEILDGLGRGHDQIGRRALPHLPRQHRPGQEGHRDLVAARALEHGNEFVQNLAHGGGRDDINVSGMHGASLREQRGEAGGSDSDLRPHHILPEIIFGWRRLPGRVSS